MIARELHTLLDNVHELQERIHTICTGKNAEEKQFLIKGLDLLRKGGSLTPILYALSLRECEELHDVLMDPPFKHDLHYYALREKVYVEISEPSSAPFSPMLQEHRAQSSQSGVPAPNPEASHLRLPSGSPPRRLPPLALSSGTAPPPGPPLLLPPPEQPSSRQFRR